MCEMRDLGFESRMTHIFHMKNHVLVSSNLKYYLLIFTNLYTCFINVSRSLSLYLLTHNKVLI
jgi:hypothetical protein